MQPGRVFNGIERIPMEWRFAGWTVGPLTWVWVAIAIFNLMFFSRVLGMPTFVTIIAVIVPLVGSLLYIRWMNTINPDLRIKELTAVMLWLSGVRSPRKTTVRYHED